MKDKLWKFMSDFFLTSEELTQRNRSSYYRNLAGERAIECTTAGKITEAEEWSKIFDILDPEKDNRDNQGNITVRIMALTSITAILTLVVGVFT